MVAVQDRFARLSAKHYRVWIVVLVLHLLLGGWLVAVTDRTVDPVPSRALDAVLIQQVAVAPPQSLAQTENAPRPEPPQPRATPPDAPKTPPRQAEPTAAQTPPAAALPPPVPNRAREVVQPATTPSPGAASIPTSQATPLPSPTSTARAATAAPGSTAAGGAPASNDAGPAPVAAGVWASASGTMANSAQSANAAAATEVAVACPGQVAPVMPRLAIRGGVTGEVVAQALIVGGKLTEVRILSGPPVFHNAVRDAMLQYRCVSSAAEVWVTQRFSFKLE